MVHRGSVVSALVAGCSLLAAWMGVSLGVTPFEVFQGSTLNQVVQKNKLVVGMEMKFYPFEYADEKGQPLGFDVDLARLMAQEMGVQLELKDMEFSGLIPALQSGKVDMIVSGMTGTLERAKAVSFSQPYFTTGLCALLSKKRVGENVERIEELNTPDRILAVKLGTTGDVVAGKLLPKAQLHRYKDETACAREVSTGRADAFIYDQFSIAKHHKENSETTRAILKPFTYEPYAIAIRKGDPDLLNWLNMFIETINRDGRYQELHRKHFHEILQ